MQNKDVKDSSLPSYIPDFKNAEEAREFLQKGTFHMQDRIGEVLEQKFQKMKLKINKILNHEDSLTELDYEVYATSILVDCRAMFLESKWRQSNSTLQNFYISRGFEQLADNINEQFVNKEIDGEKLSEIIKNWVDKRVVHFDYLDLESEAQHFEKILSILGKNTIENLFIELLKIAEEYELFKQTYGDSLTEQMDKTLEVLTSPPNSEG